MKTSRLFATLTVSLLALAGWPPSASAQAAEDPFHVAIVADGPWQRNDELRELYQGEILALTEGEVDVRFRERDYLVGDWTRATVEQEVEVLLADPEVDLILAVGPLGSHLFCCREELPKPVIAAFVLDSTLQDLPLTEEGTSGVRNLSYLVIPSTVEEDLRALAEIVPYTKLAVVFNEWYAEAIPRGNERFAALVAAAGTELAFVPVGFDVDAALASIPADVDAVYVAPLLHLPPAEQERFFDGLIEKRLPSFSLFGQEDLERGVYAAHRDPSFFRRVARRIALNVQRILLGEDAGDIPVAFPDRQELVINMEVARAIGVFPPWDVLTEAVLLNAEPEVERRLSLAGVVERAVEANLDLEARRRGLAAGAQAVERARSVLLPGLEAGASAVRIDEERAGATFSIQAETTLSAELVIEQLVFSDPALAALEAERLGQLGREQALRELRLDVTLEAATTYLDVLRAQTVVEIRRDNLRLSRSNLELARVRRTLGEAGPEEVYRWRSQIATAKRDLIAAQAVLIQAGFALNRLLHRPLEEAFQTEDVGLDDPRLITSREQVFAYVDTPLHFAAFREMMVEEGLERAPELARFDAAIAAQERLARSARRAFTLPEVFFQAQLEHLLDESGAGAGELELPGLPFAIEEAEDTRWSLALSGRYSIFAGGRRRAERMEAEETLARLRLEREALAERLEQRIRSELQQARASYAGINLSREAAEAARESLELVTDAYSRGAADVLDLLDAQSAALVADLAAADAVYVFLIDLMDVERAADNFDFFLTPEQQDAWLDRLDAYFREVQIAPRPRP